MGGNRRQTHPGVLVDPALSSVSRFLVDDASVYFCRIINSTHFPFHILSRPPRSLAVQARTAGLAGWLADWLLLNRWCDSSTMCRWCTLILLENATGTERLDFWSPQSVPNLMFCSMGFCENSAKELMLKRRFNHGSRIPPIKVC